MELKIRKNGDVVKFIDYMTNPDKALECVSGTIRHRKKIGFENLEAMIQAS